MRFNLGRLVITDAALESVSADEICIALDRHVTGDWRSLDADDRNENELALRIGSRVVSPFRATNGTQFYVVTAADRSQTTVLLSHETIENINA